MVNNPNFYSQTAKADTQGISAIGDGSDFPHTGLIKALSDGMGQNYAISGFNVTATSETAGSVSSGVIFRDGKKVDISTGAPYSITLSTSHTNGYHLLVVNSSNAVVVRNPDAVDKVPAPTAGDTVIGVLTHTNVNPFSVQFLTINKTEHSLSVGRDSSGYTESLTIESSSGDVTIKATEQDKDIIFNVNDGGTDSEVMRIDGASKNIGIGTNNPQKPLHIKSNTAAIMRLQDSSGDGAGGSTYVEFYDENSRMGYLGYGSAGSATLSLSNEENGDLNLVTNSSTRLAVKSDGKVGIGTTSPSTKLEVSGTVKATAFQGFEYFRVNQKSGQHGASTNWGTAFYLQFADTTDFDKTANTTNIIVNNASPDYITLKAGGIYQIVASVEIFVGSVTDAVDMWVEFGNATSSPTDRRHWGTARRQVRTSQTAATANWNAQKTIVIEIPSTDSDEKLYISALVNGSSSNTFNVGSYDDARTNVSITRLGDSNS